MDKDDEDKGGQVKEEEGGVDQVGDGVEEEKEDRPVEGSRELADLELDTPVEQIVTWA